MLYGTVIMAVLSRLPSKNPSAEAVISKRSCDGVRRRVSFLAKLRFLTSFEITRPPSAYPDVSSRIVPEINSVRDDTSPLAASYAALSAVRLRALCALCGANSYSLQQRNHKRHAALGIAFQCQRAVHFREFREHPPKFVFLVRRTRIRTIMNGQRNMIRRGGARLKRDARVARGRFHRRIE